MLITQENSKGPTTAAPKGAPVPLNLNGSSKLNRSGSVESQWFHQRVPQKPNKYPVFYLAPVNTPVVALQVPGVGSNYALTAGDKNGDIWFDKTWSFSDFEQLD